MNINASYQSDWIKPDVPLTLHSFHMEICSHFTQRCTHYYIVNKTVSQVKPKVFAKQSYTVEGEFDISGVQGGSSLVSTDRRRKIFKGCVDLDGHCSVLKDRGGEKSVKTTTQVKLSCPSPSASLARI